MKSDIYYTSLTGGFTEWLFMWEIS